MKPETILAWQRRLERKKWDYSERRTRGPGRPRTPGEIEALVCRLARENAWGYQVCDKWLKDRKGRKLDNDDLMHYQRIVVALNETIRLMAEIDALITCWPVA